MKKILIILLGLALTLPALADTVSQSKAAAAASAFFNGGEETRGAVKPFLVWTGGDGTRAPYAPPFYVFNNPNGGWVVIAGEDSGNAVLAWSDKGLFDPNNLPDAAAAWFKGYADQINLARSRNLAASEASLKEWSDLLDGRTRRTPTPVVVLTTATWGQSNPYNLQCPTINGKRAVTGCVATAMAITMRYHQHPSKGTGTIGGYTLKTKVNSDSTLTAPTVNLDEDSGYDWSNMPLGTPGGWNSTQKDAVAKLIYHCGLASEMKYGLGGSSAPTAKAFRSLAANMGYDASAVMLNRESYTISEWVALLKNEFDNDRVVIFDGYNPTGAGVGHCFVGDGYDSDDRIHINWGWNGSASDGYFASTYLRPGTAEDASSGDYRRAQNVIIGIRPATTNISEMVFRLTQEFCMVTDIDYSASGYPFDVSFGIANDGHYAAKCTVNLYLCSYDNTMKEACKMNRFGQLSAGSYYAASSTRSYWTGCKMTSLASSGLKPELGDKFMVAVEDSSSAYRLVTKKSAFSLNNNIPVYDIPFIAVKDGGLYSVGEYFDCVIVNSRTAPADMTVAWSFDGTPVALDEVLGQASILLTETGDHTVKAVVTIAGDTQTIVQKIRVE